MKTKMEAALEKIDLGMFTDGSNELRALVPDVPALGPVIEKLDYGDNDGAAELLRQVIASQPA